jgi:hypothetical protein
VGIVIPVAAALAKNKDRKDPIGFSRKAKAKRKLFLISRLKPIAANVTVHAAKGRGNLNSLPTPDSTYSSDANRNLNRSTHR